jgi:Ser/Thr protein kinase RdoA (MazF antagonist)
LTLDRLGVRARETVIDSGFVPESLAVQYARVSEQVIDRVRQSFDAFGPLPAVRIHGDCHAGNILWRATGPLFVDLDDCMSGPRIQDLWMFLAGDAASQQSAWSALMEGYEQFGELDYAELTLVESLRSLRMLHHAAWIAHRWHDPAFPRAFPWFADARFWERHISDLLEQLAAMDDPPILSR